MKFVKRNGVTYVQEGNRVYGYVGAEVMHEIVIECRKPELPLKSLIEIAETAELNPL